MVCVKSVHISTKVLLTGIVFDSASMCLWTHMAFERNLVFACKGEGEGGCWPVDEYMGSVMKFYHNSDFN